METLRDLIIESQNSNKNSLLQLIERFKPLINKYSYFLGTEDSRQDLILEFIKVIKKMPINNLKITSDAAIVAYIHSSLRNRYIHLSQKIKAQKVNELNLQYEGIEYSEPSVAESITIVNNLINKLSKSEKNLILLKYYKGLSDIEISKISHISRQAVNQKKNRAINKLRKEYYM